MLGRSVALIAAPVAALLLAALLAVLLWNAPSGGATGNSITSPDTAGHVGDYTSLALDASGNPVVSYWDWGNDDLKVLHCNDPNCSGGNESTTSPDTVGRVGEHTSLALDGSGNPVVSYFDNTGDDLNVLHCNDANCSGGDESITSPDTAGNVGEFTSLVLDGSGNPVVSYYDRTNGDRKVLRCSAPGCTGIISASPDTGGDVGWYTSLALDSSGYPVVSYFDFTNGDLKVLHCSGPTCDQPIPNSITSPDTAGDVGAFTSLALDGNGYPVVSYYDSTNKGLKVLHCNDANCAGSDESITSPDTAGSVGGYTSLALDGSGNPVVSYHDFDNFDLKVLHCNDPNCSGGDESITSPDTTGDVGRHPSLALDGSGYPVVSYLDFSNDDLKVLHCGDPNCSAAPPPTQSPSPTPTPLLTPSLTPTPISTPTPVGQTPTPTPTATPVGQTPSPTPTPTPTASPVIQTELTSSAAAGASQIDVASMDGFSVGDPITVNPGGSNEETSQITAFGSFILGSPLLFDHEAGEPVVLGSSGTPTPAPTLTPTAAPGEDRIWGDHNCSGEPNPVDALLTLRHDAGLSANTGDCPEMGVVVEVVGASPHLWGDVDCGGEITPVDSLKLLRFDAGLSVPQAAGCPLLGSAVLVVVQ